MPHGVGYLAWGWWVLSPQEIADAGCSAYYLITDAAGTPGRAERRQPARPPACTLDGSRPRTDNIHQHDHHHRDVSGSPRLVAFTATVASDNRSVNLVLTASIASERPGVGRTVGSSPSPASRAST